jgi:uncharacterized protein (DUF58 family)
VRNAPLAAGLGVALCLAAGAFGAAPLYVPGVGVLLIVGAATTWVLTSVRGVRTERFIARTAAEEDASLPVTVRVSRQRLPLPGAEVRSSPDGQTVPLAGFGDRIVSDAVRFPRRGRHRLGPASVLVGDPLGLCRRAVYSSDDEVLILPRVEPLRFVAVDGEPAMLGGAGVSSATADATEVDSLRPLRPGTPASRIHWPTVARTMTLMERRLVADGDRRPLVVVDPRAPTSPDALDRAMRAAASLCVHLSRQGGCGVLLPGDRRATSIDAELRGFPQLHARLAVLGPEHGAPPLGPLASADAVLWVTAGRGSSAIAQLRSRVRYLVSPDPRPRWPVQFTVAGCSGQRLERIAAGRTVAA